MIKNSQYGNATTKPLPYTCIKKQEKIPTLVEFNLILNRILHKEKIGHLFVVDIKFHKISKKFFYLMNYIHQYLKKINS